MQMVLSGQDLAASLPSSSVLLAPSGAAGGAENTSGRKPHTCKRNGAGVIAGVSRIQVYWSEWWNSESGGSSETPQAFRILLRKAQGPGDEKAAPWGFIPCKEVKHISLHSPDL